MLKRAKKKKKSLNKELVIILGSVFSQLQVLNCYVMPFKNHLITQFSFWSPCRDHKYLPVRQMGKQEVLTLYNWILVTSLEISKESIKHRFKKYFISNNLDRWDDYRFGNF